MMTFFLTEAERQAVLDFLTVFIDEPTTLTAAPVDTLVGTLRMLRDRIQDAPVTSPYRALAVAETDAIAKEDADAANMDERNQTAATVHLRNEIVRQRDELATKLRELSDVQRVQLENERLRAELAATGPPEVLVELDTLRQHCADLNQKLEVEQRKTLALRQALAGERVVRQELEGTNILDAATGKYVEKKP